MGLKEKIFKAYDIRGIYPDDFNEKSAYNIGRAFVVLTKAKNVVVSQDMRLSSPQIASSLTKGIVDQGADVISIGMAGTDQFYFVMGEYGYDGGFMITASHNPKEYNGFKIVKKGNIFISQGNGMEELKDLSLKAKYPEPKQKGKIIIKDYRKQFITKMLSYIDFNKVKSFKIAMDGSSGMAGPALSEIFQNSPCKIYPLFFKPDGSFPGHEPNPMEEENRKLLEKKVVEEKCDFGFIFDGDADRFIMVDNNGKFIFPDFIISIIAEDILKNNLGAKIISDVTCGWSIKDTVNKYKGQLIIERTGHSFIKRRMKETGALFAGETSGHFYFKNFYGCDTGILPALILLQIISQSKKSFTEIIEAYRKKYFLTGIINFEVINKKEVMEKIENYYKNEGASISRIDGVGVEFDNWRFILRPSNTESLLRLILEARSADLMNKKKEEVSKLIQKR